MSETRLERIVSGGVTFTVRLELPSTRPIESFEDVEIESEYDHAHHQYIHYLTFTGVRFGERYPDGADN